MAKRKMSENSLKNLKPNTFNNCEIAKKAQKKSVESRKKNQTIAELLKMALTLPNPETGEINNIAMVNAIINKAIKGDILAFQTIRDSIGEKPTNKQELLGDIGSLSIIVTKEDGGDYTPPPDPLPQRAGGNEKIFARGGEEKGTNDLFIFLFYICVLQHLHLWNVSFLCKGFVFAKG